MSGGTEELGSSNHPHFASEVQSEAHRPVIRQAFPKAVSEDGAHAGHLNASRLNVHNRH